MSCPASLARCLILLLSLGLSGGVLAAPETRELSYQAGDTRLQGYLALPEGAGPHPGVLVVHEWWGHNDYARRRAEMLAELGYVALAVDMYGDGAVADHPKKAGEFAGKVRGDFPLARARFEAAMDLLAAQPAADAERLAAIGYCFGGGVVLNMARAALPGLDAVVSFHGSLDAAVAVGEAGVPARVLVLNGAADGFVSRESIAAFAGEMAAAGTDFEFVNYRGVKHSFTNPQADAVGARFDLPLAYDADADADAWRRMQAFLAATFAD